MVAQMASARQTANEPILREVEAALAARRPGAPGLADFARTFFAHAAREDLEPLTANDLADLAIAAFDHAETRQPGAPKIRFADPALEGTGEAALVTTIDIVNDNMPFLLDSVMDLLQERGLAVHLVVHPIVAVRRDASGRRTDYLGEIAAPPRDALRESMIHIHVERIEAEADRAGLAEELAAVLTDVRRAVEDWPAMRARVEEVIRRYRQAPPPLPQEEVGEALEFLTWLLDNNFTFLGIREWRISGGADLAELSRVEGSDLGLLRNSELRVLKRGDAPIAVTPQIRDFLRQPIALIVTKANVRATVHRRVHMDYVGVKLFDAEGALASELRIVGLFTSTAYTRSARSIPYLRRKYEQVLARSGFDPGSHSGKALINVLETYPRDELFQIDTDTLFRFATAIQQLDERPRIRVLPRRDRFDRFVSVLVFLPRDRFNTDVRIAIGEHLAEAFAGRVSAFYPSFPEGSLVRVHYIVGRDPGPAPDPSQSELEAGVAAIVRTWEDRLRQALAQREPASAQALFRVYGQAFSAAYREAFPAAHAVEDIEIMEGLSEDRVLALAFRPRPESNGEIVDLKLYRRDAPIPLSDRMPILEHMGFRGIAERTYRVRRAEGGEVWLHDTALTRARGSTIDLETLRERLQAAFLAIWTGEAENDGYNALTLEAGLPWRDVAMLRGLGHYLRQVPVTFSQDYMWSTLVLHSAIARQLAALFYARFDPDLAGDRAAEEARIGAEIEEALSTVASLNEDAILRRFVNLIESCLRTNMFQTDAEGRPHPVLSFKFDPRRVEGLPLPRPYREIWVYSPRVEGVHLRGGPIARGGIRWSDRPQDFRTEVLGLAKAQQVKNAVIVPVGAKGGFVPKRLPEGGARDTVFQEGKAAYEIFISSLLDITDDFEGNAVVPPAQVVRHEGDDPYLVVAADKGTATFSDTANAISLAHGFWLADAFASGGSAGYDHKEMGITARGGWEAVKRHFREMNIDIQTTPFTVVGVGDMSGDVFGNGMLLSRAIRLQAAFDHRDIFIDPDPDPETSYEERARLFALQRSSWADYDKTLISKGGGVFSRKLKSIPLTPEIRALLGIGRETATPAEVMGAILRAPADLLWFGGIGTYVRASTETDAQVGDKANDPVRIAAPELRAKVIGEGANLAMTQSARIEYALAGGRLNTDAIDNSAGVNSSDVEVNIKIALSTPLAQGKLTLEARNELLREMTDEVAGLVLRNNFLQTLAISLAERAGLEDLDFQARLMLELEGKGALDRVVEVLPGTAVLAARAQAGAALTRPELAVLLAYAKLDLFNALVASSVPDDPYLSRELMRYFPRAMQERFAPAIADHRLRREIIATQLSNSMINRGGPTFVSRITDQTGAPAERIAAAFAVTRDSYGMTALNAEIDALDCVVDGRLQLDLYDRVRALLQDQTLWFLRHGALDRGLASVIEHYRDGLDALSRTIDIALGEQARMARDAEEERLLAAKVPPDLARRLANLPYLAQGPDIIQVAEATRASLAAAAQAYFAVGGYFATDRLTHAARALPAPDYYDRVALNQSIDRLVGAQRRLAEAVLRNGRAKAPVLEAWIEEAGPQAEAAHRVMCEIADDPALTVSKVAVASGILRDLAA
jgi:glutamate dehydrogenase